jgi:hypothetical protein
MPWFARSLVFVVLGDTRVMSEASKSQSFLFLSFLWEYLRASAFELWDTSCGTILEVDTILQFDRCWLLQGKDVNLF